LVCIAAKLIDSPATVNAIMVQIVVFCTLESVSRRGR
jgi:hypothetical protein